MKKLPTSFHRCQGTQGLPKIEAHQHNKRTLSRLKDKQQLIPWGAESVKGETTLTQLCCMTESGGAVLPPRKTLQHLGPHVQATPAHCQRNSKAMVNDAATIKPSPSPASDYVDSASYDNCINTISVSIVLHQMTGI